MSDQQTTDTKPAMRATVGRRELVQFLEAVSAFRSDAVVTIDGDGISTTAQDMANVAHVSATVSPGPDCTVDGRATIGVLPGRLLDVVDGIEVDTVTLTSDGRDVLNVELGQYSYSLRVINPDDISASPVGSPTGFDAPFACELDGNRFREAVSWFDEFAGDVRLSYDSDSGEVSMAYAESEKDDDVDTEAAEMTFSDDEVAIVGDRVDAVGLYSLDFLADIAAAVPEDCRVAVRLGNNVPMEVRFGGASGGAETLDVTFVQAPRIRGDER